MTTPISADRFAAAKALDRTAAALEELRTNFAAALSNGDDADLATAIAQLHVGARQLQAKELAAAWDTAAPALTQIAGATAAGVKLVKQVEEVKLVLSNAAKVIAVGAAVARGDLPGIQAALAAL